MHGETIKINRLVLGNQGGECLMHGIHKVLVWDRFVSSSKGQWCCQQQSLHQQLHATCMRVKVNVKFTLEQAMKT